MSDWGFDFVRLPMAYPQWIDYDSSKPIRPEDMHKIKESALDPIDELIALAHKYKLHVSLNLHRAPGFCMNSGFQEPYNLWKDSEAQEAFCFQWGMWAKRYKDTPAAKISFDLLNEPCTRKDMNDQSNTKTGTAANWTASCSNCCSSTEPQRSPKPVFKRSKSRPRRAGSKLSDCSRAIISNRLRSTIARVSRSGAAT